MNFFDDFDLADNAIMGGIAGFVEEFVENEQLSEKNGEPVELSNDDISEENIKNDGLRLLYNQNPNLVLHIINKFLEHKKVARTNRDFKIIMADIEEEIKQMKEDEKNADKNGC
jgi:hypothetical protein